MFALHLAGLWLIPGPPHITPLQAVAPAVTVTLITTFIEAVSIAGLDNLTITAAAVLILSLWPF
ncbi:MAG: hypothetical protein HC804_05800 [Anaerolineae bacterium]|nr:hypothetical protein [Anaerolineae bacterium]